MSGSPSAAENPPHDRQWRAAVATGLGRPPAAVAVALDFMLETRRTLIDLDNLARLGLAALQDAGALTRGLVGLDSVLATKRTAEPVGLGVSLFLDSADHWQPYEEAQLVVDSLTIPREGNAEEMIVWRDTVTRAWTGEVTTGPVALDIAAQTTGSLGAVLKPVIDGLESYLGRGAIGGRTFRPLDERIVILQVRRVTDLPVALHVTAGSPTPSMAGRRQPPMPSLPAMDPDFLYSMSDLEAIERRHGWERAYLDR